MRRSIVVVILCVCAGLCGWLYVGASSPDLSLALARAIQSSPDGVVDFTTVAPFPWERVYIFEPYTSHDRIHKAVGFRWSGARRTTIEDNEGVNLVVLVRGGAVANWFEHTRSRGDLMHLADPKGYGRAEARFRVVGGGLYKQE